ncbi:MAG: adenosylcobalamin-dependent ribonucleoside-diphosphate reductase [Candidatus Aenigmatarchaeota archaeon]
MISKIKKRDGKIVPFDQDKITHAIHRALLATGEKDGKHAKKLSILAVKLLGKRFEKAIPTVEDAQDAVIEVLNQNGLKNVAEEYSSYRKAKTEIRELGKRLGLEPEMKLSVNAMEVLKNRYLLKNEKGKIIETPVQMFERVAKAVASADKIYGVSPEAAEKEFFGVMSRLEFLPNSPTLFNANAPLGQLAACFVLPVEDSLESIFNAVKHTALIEQSGGGVGFSFSRLRPKGDVVKSTAGVASGPVSFMKVFDAATDAIKAGGRRRGAMMGILSVHHPDIMEFITAKSEGKALSNFNLSVSVTDEFLNALDFRKDYVLMSPRTRKVVGKASAESVWNSIIENAWSSGDPGVIFIDEVNRHNPTPQAGRIEATNPCGEQPLLPYESCNLGSINLSKMVKNGDVDWEKIRKTVRTAVHFLDNVIDSNRFPMKEIEAVTKANRKIGLGVMGFADMLITLGIPYNSERAVTMGEKLMRFITDEARKASEEIGKRRGSFPNFARSTLAGSYKAMRNATVTTIAPTGSISIIAGCSSGIEPIFAISFIRKHILGGRTLFEVNPAFEAASKKRGFYSAEILAQIAKSGSLQKVKGVPEDIKRIFVTALDIPPEWHVRMQAAFQKYTDNAVSKTVNLPQDATPDDVKKVYNLARKLKCKGITVYRYGSKSEQVLYVGDTFVTAEAEFAGGCPTKTCPVPG